MAVSDEDKTIARAAAAAFGGQASVRRHWDDPHASSVDLVACKDAPWSGVTSYATIGVSTVPLLKDGRDIGVRTELVGACGSQVGEFPNYLATAAFCIINSGWFVAPGIIFPDVLTMYSASETMKHLLFVPPFLWDGKLRTLDVGRKKVAWLLVVPISQAELELADARGVPALESLFEEHQIDIFDLQRSSVV